MFRASHEYRPRHAVILAHPNPSSFNGLVANAYCEAAEACGHDAILRDLYALDFDPLLKDCERPRDRAEALSPDVESELAVLAGTDVFVFVFPIWFGMPPAILKGYVDRVLGAGVTPRQVRDRTGQTIMRDKRLVCISSSGASKVWLEDRDQPDSLRSVFGRYLQHALSLRSYEDLHFGETVEGLEQDYVDQNLKDVQERARSICGALGGSPAQGSVPTT